MITLEFDFENQPEKSKRSLPSTSHEAYAKLKQTDERERHYAKILTALKYINEGHYERIAEVAGLERHAVARRLSEMERDQKIRKTGAKLPTSTNRNAFVYTLK